MSGPTLGYAVEMISARNESLSRQSSSSQQQSTVANERYHILCAAVSDTFELREVPHDDTSRIHLFARVDVFFDQYTAFKLEPLADVHVSIDERGVSTQQASGFARFCRGNWEARQGGILYCIGENSFWDVSIRNYRSSEQTAGSKAWDRLFSRLKENGFDRGCIPCMFFATKTGCLDTQCLFLHDEAACTRDREKLHSRRRWELGKPTERDIAAREWRTMERCRGTRSQVVPAAIPPRSRTTYANILDDEDEDDIDTIARRIAEDSRNIKKICNNANCLAVRMKRGTTSAAPIKADVVKMLVCSRCKIATYCSPECQKEDWKRHKKEPCAPFEDIVQNDALWSLWGKRKGAGRYQTRVMTM